MDGRVGLFLERQGLKKGRPAYLVGAAAPDTPGREGEILEIEADMSEEQGSRRSQGGALIHGAPAHLARYDKPHPDMHRRLAPEPPDVPPGFNVSIVPNTDNELPIVPKSE